MSVVGAGPPAALVDAVRDLQAQIRTETWSLVRRDRPDALITEKQPARASRDAELRVDVPAERVIREFFRERAEHLPRLTVVAEGLEPFLTGRASDPSGWIVIMDPVDGSRELAKGRAAWALAGIAPDHGPDTTLGDIVVAIQTELPPSRQSESLVLTARATEGAWGRVWDMKSASWTAPARRLRSSAAPSVRGGAVGIASYFPGASELGGRVIERALRRALGPPHRGEAQVFFDTYISTGGCIANLALGHFRLHVDVRPELERLQHRRGETAGMCAKPYDLSTILIADEAGAVIRDDRDLPVRYPLDTTTDCSVLGYANNRIQSEMAPSLLEVLREAAGGDSRRTSE